MLASREQKFKDRLPRLERRYKLNVTPVAAVFGANASGKSNLLYALRDLENLLVNPPRQDSPLPHYPFKLDEKSRSQPTRLELLFAFQDEIFEYIIEYDRWKIHREKLTRHLSRTESVLFERDGDSISSGEAVKSNALDVHLASIPPNNPIVAFWVH